LRYLNDKKDNKDILIQSIKEIIGISMTKKDNKDILIQSIEEIIGYKMTISQIIKDNNTELLKKSIKEIDLNKISKAAYTAILNCRYDCFYIIHEESKKYLNEYRYQQVYIKNIILAASKYNKIDVLSFIINDEAFNLENDCFFEIIDESWCHYRIIKFLVNNIDFSDDNLYHFITSYLSREIKKDTKNIFHKKINFITQSFNYNEESFYNFLDSNRYFNIINFRSVNYFRTGNFFDFLEEYDESNYILKKYKEYESFIDSEEKPKYIKKYLKVTLTDKIHSF
jgi:hypothetical protein